MAAGNTLAITITGALYASDGENTASEPEITVQRVQAQHVHRGDTHYLFYEEQPEGFPSPLKTCIKLKNNMVEINRRGPGGSIMNFVPGETCRTDYFTPYGILPLDIVTKKLLVKTVENVGENSAFGSSWPKVWIAYDLINAEKLLGRYEICIE